MFGDNRTPAVRTRMARVCDSVVCQSDCLGWVRWCCPLHPSPFGCQQVFLYPSACQVVASCLLWVPAAKSPPERLPAFGALSWELSF